MRVRVCTHKAQSNLGLCRSIFLETVDLIHVHMYVLREKSSLKMFPFGLCCNKDIFCQHLCRFSFRFICSVPFYLFSRVVHFLDAVNNLRKPHLLPCAYQTSCYQCVVGSGPVLDRCVALLVRDMASIPNTDK